MSGATIPGASDGANKSASDGPSEGTNDGVTDGDSDADVIDSDTKVTESASNGSDASKKVININRSTSDSVMQVSASATGASDDGR